MKTNALIYYIDHRNGSWYPGTVIKTAKKKVKININGREKWVYPKSLVLQNDKIAEDQIGIPIKFSELPKTGDPKYLPKFIKEAGFQLIDIDGIIKHNVGIGWVQKRHAESKDYHTIPYLISD